MGFPWVARFGPDTILLECLQQLQAEIAACYGLRCWDGTVFLPVNSGEIGDVVHQAEPTSMHNPQPCPDGVWRVMACDWSGGGFRLLALFLQALALAGDPRMVPFGFAQRGDGYGLAWGTWAWKWTGRDFGHAHGNTTLATQYPAGTPRSYTPAVWAAITSRASWGLRTFLLTGRLDTSPEDDNVTTNDDLTWARLNGITNQNPDKQLATGDAVQQLSDRVGGIASSLRGPQLFVLTGAPEVWAVVGSARMWVSPIAYARMGQPLVSTLSPAHPWAQLPTIGPAPEPLRYVQFEGGSPADQAVIWAVCGGIRTALSWDDWVGAGKPPPTRVPATDPAATAAVA